MDSTNKIIRSAIAVDYKKIRVVLTDGTVLFADLSEFNDVYCFPSKEDWKNLSVDSYGRGIVWVSRFEVHIDQVLACTFSVEQEGRKTA